MQRLPIFLSLRLGIAPADLDRARDPALTVQKLGPEPHIVFRPAARLDFALLSLRETPCIPSALRWEYMALATRSPSPTRTAGRQRAVFPNRLIRRLDAAIMPLEDGHGPPAALFPVPLTLIRVPCDS